MPADDLKLILPSFPLSARRAADAGNADVANTASAAIAKSMFFMKKNPKELVSEKTGHKKPANDTAVSSTTSQIAAGLVQAHLIT